MSEETQRHLKSVETRPGIICGSFKVHKNCVDGCPPFKPILSSLETYVQAWKVSSVYFRAINY